MLCWNAYDRGRIFTFAYSVLCSHWMDGADFGCGIHTFACSTAHLFLCDPTYLAHCFDRFIREQQFWLAPAWTVDSVDRSLVQLARQLHSWTCVPICFCRHFLPERLPVASLARLCA